MTRRSPAIAVAIAFSFLGCGSPAAPMAPAVLSAPAPREASRPPDAPVATSPAAAAASPLVAELASADAERLCAEIDALGPPEDLEASGMCQTVATFDVVTNVSKSRRGRITKAKIRASCRKSFGKCMKAKAHVSRAGQVGMCSLHPLDQCDARVDELRECVRAKVAGFARKAARGIDECDAVSEIVAAGRADRLSLPEGCEKLLARCPGM
jgi:hypothetical protein